ncbi:MAG: hypothetical protein ACPGPG_12255, partial [Luminiphilus sp.]
TVRGGRPSFFSNPESDRLLAIIVRLLTEHSVLAERVKTLEALLDQSGIISSDQIEAFEPNQDVDEAWMLARMQLIKDVLESGANIPLDEP